MEGEEDGMSAELLRKAASLIRERAEAATPGPWTFENAPNGQAPMVVGNSMAVAETFDKPNLPDAQHIASWHPVVALAVADLLDDLAEQVEGAFDPARFADLDTATRKGIAVARTYLGETP